ncbi:HlyC/CorC family transporter [Methylomonas paludis]|uniref:HlyC/CorC family transporter n=1 Tax=Methylomonas paludis TaxID=1173101 RepID=A0A975MP48_9GAMM|nr:HlyC/CorC family transporter [Methylomonas paludis]QWF71382.1 HlyC/CorC family transporter [Methylomonas paludis]
MNDISLGILFSILAALLVISAFFAGSETALMTLNRYRLQHLVKKKHRGAIKTLALLKRPDRLIGLILLGSSFVNIMASSLATVIAIRIGGDQAIAPATALLTFVLLIFSEVTPKTLGALKPEKLAFISAWIYVPLLKIFYPVVFLVNLISGLILRLFGINTQKGKIENINKDELKSIVADAEHLMPVRYQNMLLSILDLESARVEDIMTQRQEIVGIDLEAPIAIIIEQIQNSPHTRLPVYKKTIDRVIGFAHLRTMLALLNRPDFDKHSITENLIKPFFIPAGTSIHRQMQTFKTEKLRIGLVVDEYGDVSGLLTLDDVLQEIVGELIAEEPNIKLHNDGSYLVNGSVTIRELNRITQWNLPTEGPKTLNGLIIEYLETIPKAGTSVKLHGHPLEIIECDSNTIRQVKFYSQP